MKNDSIFFGQNSEVLAIVFCESPVRIFPGGILCLKSPLDTKPRSLFNLLSLFWLFHIWKFFLEQTCKGCVIQFAKSSDNSAHFSGMGTTLLSLWIVVILILVLANWKCFMSSFDEGMSFLIHFCIDSPSQIKSIMQSI